MILETILTSIVSGAGGGVVGAVSSLFKKRMERKTLELQLTHDLEMFKAGLKEREMEIQANKDMATMKLEETELQVGGEIEVASMEAFAASYKHDSSIKGGKFVESVRALMRPAVTLYLLGGYSVILFTGLSDPAAFTQAVVEQGGLTTAINGVSFLTNMSVSWWFGSRSSGTPTFK